MNYFELNRINFVPLVLALYAPSIFACLPARDATGDLRQNVKEGVFIINESRWLRRSCKVTISEVAIGKSKTQGKYMANVRKEECNLAGAVVKGVVYRSCMNNILDIKEIISGPKT